VERVTSADGTQIAFERIGEGPSLVLVGGALSDRAAAAPVAALLADRFSVLTYDRRGRGDSGDTAPYAVEREVEDLDALITGAGGSAFVFGHSSGAVLAMEAGMALGSRIPLLAVYEPPFVVDDSRPPLPSDLIARLDDLVRSGRRGDAVEAFLVNGPGEPTERVAEIRSSPHWSALEAIAHTIAYDVRVMGETMGGSPAALARWAALDTPTLVLDGGASDPWQRSATQALARVLPRATHASLPGQTHGAEPDVLAPALRSFFENEAV
jgi:pimeloyl-ACP methyl ester carboxylesterase